MKLVGVALGYNAPPFSSSEAAGRTGGVARAEERERGKPTLPGGWELSPKAGRGGVSPCRRGPLSGPMYFVFRAWVFLSSCVHFFGRVAFLSVGLQCSSSVGKKG